jgi:hypothetical protein
VHPFKHGIDRLAAAILLESSLPILRRSACYVCPLSRSQDWWELRKRWPRLYESARALENNVLAERGRDFSLGYKPLREHHNPKPYEQATSPEGVRLFSLAQSYLGRIAPAWPSYALCLAARTSVVQFLSYESHLTPMDRSPHCK